MSGLGVRDGVMGNPCALVCLGFVCMCGFVCTACVCVCLRLADFGKGYHEIDLVIPP